MVFGSEAFEVELDARNRLLRAAQTLKVPVSADELCKRASLSPPKRRYLLGVLADEGQLGRRAIARNKFRYGPAELIEEELRLKAEERSAKGAASRPK